MTGRIVSFLDAVCGTIGRAVPRLGSCQRLPGPVDLEEIDRRTFRTPAVAVSILRLTPDPRTDDALDGRLSVAVYVLTDDQAGLDRVAAGWNLVTAVCRLVSGNQWGLTDIGLPRELRVDPIYETRIDRNGVALWAVTWEQVLRRITDGVCPAGVMPANLYIGDEKIWPEADA